MKKLIIIITLFLSQINTIRATVLGSYFTYQGELIVNGQPANNTNYDFEIKLFDVATGGTPLDTINRFVIPIKNGLFSFELDFGDLTFKGDERWIEIAVKPSGIGAYTSLPPRQLITNAPYAIHSQFVGENGVFTYSISDGAVTSSKLGTNSVTSAKLENNSVTSDKIANGTIQAADISSQAVTRVQIAANTIQRSEVDSTQIQERITGTCAAGSSIRVIAQDGSVTCETDDLGTAFAGWGLTGNAGTNPTTDYIGTSDNQPLIFKVNNSQGMQLKYASFSSTVAPNFIVGTSSNTITDLSPSNKSSGSAIIGGSSNAIVGSDSMVAGRGNTINNANNSTISGGVFNVMNASQSTIGGGNTNKIDTNGLDSFIGGGTDNTIDALYSVIPGGFNNSITGNYGFAAGWSSKVSHTGGWVWNDSSDPDPLNSFATTAENQFLIRAVGGVGIGTNAPASPLHIKGQGTTFGTALTEVVMAVEPNTTNDDVSIAINRLASNKESALLFTTNQAPDFDIRSVDGQALDFSNYDNVGSPRLMMRINDGITKRIDINGNLEPWSNGIYNLGGINGGSEFRWATLYTVNVDTTNAVNVTSDRRLKDNIKEMDYGLAEILSMQPVTYSMKSDAEKHTHMGLIAQDVETIIPEIVNQKNDAMHTRSMRYGELIPVLIKATQEQQVLIEQQSKEITELKSMLRSVLATNKIK